MNSNFLHDYAIYSSGNEAPAEFHMWGALTALSSLCGRRLWTDQGFFTVYPNLYTIFVGRPGIKKTTAMDIAQLLVHSVSRKVGQAHAIPIAPATTSKEMLIDIMTKKDTPCKKVFQFEGKPRYYTQIAIFASEIANLLAVGGDAIAYITLLTDISDPRDSFDTGTLSRGLKELPGPYVTMIGCMTPETTTNLIKENALSGGFSRRCIFVYADKNSKPVPRPILTQEQKDAWDRTILRGAEIMRLQGAFVWSDSAMQVYDSWYAQNFEETSTAPTIALQNFLMSKPTMVIKIAMLLQLAESNELVLTDEKISLSIDLLTSVQPHIQNVFSGVGRNPHAATLAGIQETIFAASQTPPFYIPKKTLQMRFLRHASLKEIDSMLEQLTQTNQISLQALNIKGALVSAYIPYDQVDAFKARQKAQTAGLS